MGGPVVIIQISIRVDEGSLQNDPLKFLNPFFGSSRKSDPSTLS